MGLTQEKTNIDIRKIPEKIFQELYSKADIFYFVLNLEGAIASCNVVAREKLAGLANEAKDLTAIFVTIIKSTKKNNS